MTADETARIESLTAAASAAVSISIGGSAAGAVTTSSNTLTSGVSAWIEDSGNVSSAGGVLVAANDNSNVSAEIVSVALSAGLISLAVGVALVDNTIGNDVSAFIDQADVTAGGTGDIAVTASSAHHHAPKARLAQCRSAWAARARAAVRTPPSTGITQAYVNGGALTAIGNEIEVSARGHVDGESADPGAVGRAGGGVGDDLTGDASAARLAAWAGGNTTVSASKSRPDGHRPDHRHAGHDHRRRRGVHDQHHRVADRHHPRNRGRGGFRGRHHIGAGELNLLATSTTSGVGAASSASVSAIGITALTVDSTVDNATRAAIAPLANGAFGGRRDFRDRAGRQQCRIQGQELRAWASC